MFDSFLFPLMTKITDPLLVLLINGIILFILSTSFIIAEIYKKPLKKKSIWPFFLLFLSTFSISLALQDIATDYNKNKPQYKVEAKQLEKLLSKFKDDIPFGVSDKKDLNFVDLSTVDSFIDLKNYYYGMKYLTFKKLDVIIAGFQKTKDEIIENKNSEKYRNQAKATLEKYPNIISYDELPGGAPTKQVSSYNKLNLLASEVDAKLKELNGMLDEVHRYKKFLEEVDTLIEEYVTTSE